MISLSARLRDDAKWTYSRSGRLMAREPDKLLTEAADRLDDLRALLEEFVDAMERYQMDVDDGAPPRHRDMMERARAALTPSPCPGDVGKDAVRCAHEAYQGKCCHCGVPIIGGRALSATPAQPVDETERLRIKALRAAEQFIVNGIEMGYITMPDASTPDSAHETLPLIRAALTPSALSPEPVQKELPEGHRWCRHCEQKDPHCSVCEGVGYLPSALSGDAGEGE